MRHRQNHPSLLDASAFDRQIAAEVKEFNPGAAFPSPKELKRTDRVSQFGICAGYQALLDSGLDLEKVDRDEIGVFIGSGIGGLHTTAEQHLVLLERGPKRISPFMIPMLILNMGSGLFFHLPQITRPQFCHLFRLRHLRPRHWRGLADH